MANAQRVLNEIQSLQVEGVKVEDKEKIKRHVEDYFGKLYRTSRLKVDGLQLPCIDTSQENWL